jgi:hypothetical protein
MLDYARDERWVDVIIATVLSCQQRERRFEERLRMGQIEMNGQIWFRLYIRVITSPL